MVELSKKEIRAIVKVLGGYKNVTRESLAGYVLSVEWHENGYPAVSYSKKGMASPLPNTKVLPAISVFNEVDGKYVIKENLEKLLYNYFSKMLLANYLPDFDKLHNLQMQCAKFKIDLNVVYDKDRLKDQWDLWLTLYTADNNFSDSPFKYTKDTGFHVKRVFQKWLQTRKDNGHAIKSPSIECYDDSFSVISDYRNSAMLVDVLSLFVNEVLAENDIYTGLSRLVKKP